MSSLLSPALRHAIWIAGAVWWLGAGSGGCQRTHLKITTIHMGDVAVKVEVADNDESRARGLMHRDAVKSGTGMLFVYPEDAPRSFWMRNTRVPLSIAFISRSGKILRIRDMTPMSTQHVQSLYPVPYAVEVGQGWFAKMGIEEGDHVEGLPPPSSAH